MASMLRTEKESYEKQRIHYEKTALEWRQKQETKAERAQKEFDENIAKLMTRLEEAVQRNKNYEQELVLLHNNVLKQLKATDIVDFANTLTLPEIYKVTFAVAN
jgi:Skp family chaperone for outer membrane proteins